MIYHSYYKPQQLGCRFSAVKVLLILCVFLCGNPVGVACDSDTTGNNAKWLIDASLTDADDIQSRSVQVFSELLVENNKGSLKTKVSAFGYSDGGQVYIQPSDNKCAKKIPLRERRDMVGLK